MQITLNQVAPFQANAGLQQFINVDQSAGTPINGTSSPSGTFTSTNSSTPANSNALTAGTSSPVYGGFTAAQWIFFAAVAYWLFFEA
jgi:hypothetical protein